MSYILEALKKAQAERQLGSAPTIHDLSLQSAPQARAGGTAVPLWMVGAGLAVLAAAGGVLWWRQSVPPGVAVVVAQNAAPPPPVVAVPQPAPVPVAAAPAPVVSAPVAAPAPAALAAPAPPVMAPPVPRPVPVAAQPKPLPLPKPVAAPKPAPAPAQPAAPEESLPTLRELPQSVQQGLPQVAFGGYMYSNNPADRLLLIDKVLRHEGEEVAPGLILERLLPKAAVMNYRGTRYRVPY